MQFRETLHRKLLLICCIIIVYASFTFAQERQTLKELPLYQSINIAYVVGGQVYNDNFLYNPGYCISYSIGKKIHDDISVGAGLGYMPLTNERFIPLYIEILGNKKKKSNAPFIKFQGGYSVAWYTGRSETSIYELNGGLYFNAGLGRKIKINEKYTLLFQWSYCHQFAEMGYEIYGGQEYEEMLNYDMLQLSVGLIF
jgi:hypothetical protein